MAKIPRHPYEGIRVGKYYTEIYSESKSIQIQSQNWGRENQLSMEGVTLDYF